MRDLILPFLLFCSCALFSQNKILWANDIVINEVCFKDELSNLAEDNVQEMFFHANYEFSYQMTNAQFAFTKNWNRYVEAFYIPELSWMENGELKSDLLLLANLQFDLAELYARKLRKKLYDSKKLSSSPNFYTIAYQEVNNEYNKFSSEINSRLRTSNDWGPILIEYTKSVNAEINQLGDFCRLCKPPKKKKKNK